MSYKDQEARRGPGFDLKGGQWRPEYNEVIAGMLGIQQRIHGLMQIMMQMIQGVSWQPPEQGEHPEGQIEEE